MRRLSLFVANTFILLLAACGGEPTVVPMDGGTDGLVIRFDAGRDARFTDVNLFRCARDSDCNDRIPCTIDSCDTTSLTCRNVPANESCDDHNFCNGVEICSSSRGCVAGPEDVCSDNNACTLDACDTNTQICSHSARDVDQDGDPDIFCTGGNDCDDRDPIRSSTAPEICRDGVDNDCDQMVDETANCTRIAHDTCSDPLDVSAGGAFNISLRGAATDHRAACGGAGVQQDVILTFTLAEARDVNIRASAGSIITLALRSTCTDATPASESKCRRGMPSVLARRALAAGTYYVVVAAPTGVDVALSVAFNAASLAPTNETCASPVVIESTTQLIGSFLDTTNDVGNSCGSSFSGDLVYQLHLTSSQNIRATGAGIGGEPLSFSLRSTCARGAQETRCVVGSPFTTTFYELAAGDYYVVIVPSMANAEFAFTTSIEFMPSAPEPEGESCSRPQALTEGMTLSGSLATRDNNFALSCGGGARDAVHAFTLSERADVYVDTNTGNATAGVAIRRTCSDSSAQSELRCSPSVSGRALHQTLRNLSAGTYNVLIDSVAGGNYTIAYSAHAPSTPVTVTGNDTCEAARDIPEVGGVFSGSTASLSDNYNSSSDSCGLRARSADAAYRLVLTARKRVIASTVGSTLNAVLMVYQNTCTGIELACDDNSGGGSVALLDRGLDPGTYYLIVDGSGTGAVGSYALDVVTLTP